MPIIKLTHKNTDYYLMWSTVVDAPVTWGMSLDEIRAWYKKQYGVKGLEDFDRHLPAINEMGVAGVKLPDLLSSNRAGKNETHLSIKKIIAWYCIKKQEPK